MELNKNFHYDEEYDNLIVSQRDENDIVKKNFLFDDFVFSVTEDGKIVGIEIMDVTNYFEELGINPRVIKEIKRVEISVKPKRDFIYIGLNLVTKEVEQKVPLIHVPIKTIQYAHI